MTKTDEFRIKESNGVFTVERKVIDNSRTSLFNWHTYYNEINTTLGKEKVTPFIFSDYEGQYRRGTWGSLQFPTLELAKEFITNELSEENELKTEVKPKEDVIHHSYP